MIWRRPVDPAFRAWIDALAPERLSKARSVTRPEQVREAVLPICERSDVSDCAQREALIDDAARMANGSGHVMRARHLQVRFDVVTKDARGKFHVDAVAARLVCALRGTGARYGVSIEGADPERIFTAPTGAPIVLRGRLWPERPASGPRHRSPPIEGSGETRSALVVDPVDQPDYEL